jgi:hypothetical protein
MFVHHVFFWMKEDLTEVEAQLFEKTVATLLTIEHVKLGDVGKPAATDRPVIDRSYSYSLLLVFSDQAAHDAYQPHPVHKAFIETCSHLWTKVLIYDSETVVGV